jgi:hypothetical protein
MFVDPHYGTSFISSSLLPDFEVDPRFFLLGGICGSLFKTTVPIADPEIIVQQKFLNSQWLPIESILRLLHKDTTVQKQSDN